MIKQQIEGQMSLFDLLEQPQEINTVSQVRQIEEREILKGSGFSQGKTRIYNFFKQDHTEKESVEFLKKEYGVGGWTIPEGMADHNASGIDITFNKPIGKTTAVHIGWPMVAILIKKLISEGRYKPDDDFETMTIQRAAELIEEETGIKFKLDEKHFKDCYSAKHKGFEISIYFTHYVPDVRDGRRFLDLSINKKTMSSGNPCESISEAIRTIKKRIFECRYSGHNCNKEELWKLAETLDDPFCPHVCCRNCATKGCGARCNGSEEPKDKVKCKKAAECEAYPNACTGTMEHCRCGGPFKWSEKQKRKEVDVRGIMDDGYCPTCGGCIMEDLSDKCNYCGQILSWEHWKTVNED